MTARWGKAQAESAPKTRWGAASASGADLAPKTRWGAASASGAGQATINLGADREAHAGDLITLTATVTDTTSVTWAQTAGPVVTRTDSALSTTFRAPVELEPSTVTIQAAANNGSDTVQITTRSAPVSYWDGATQKPGFVTLKA